MDSNDETMARSLSSDASQMDRLQMEMNELIKKISLHSSKLSPGPGNFNKSFIH